MKKASHHSLETLRARGYRITAARRHLVETLSRANGPQDIRTLAEETKSDEVSVYRNISVLQAEGLLEEILIKGTKPRYALAHHHHHHAVCTQCKRVAHLDCDNSIETPKRVPGFHSLSSHEVTFYGLCRDCA